MTASQSADAEAESTAHGKFLDETFPDIARSMGAESVLRVRETTCTGALPGDRSAVENTSWIADGDFASTRLLGGKHEDRNMVMTVLLNEDRDGHRTDEGPRISSGALRLSSLAP